MTVPAQIGAFKYKVNVYTLLHEPVPTLDLNKVGVCNVTLAQAIAFDSYLDNRATGSFLLIDRLTNATVGAGMIDFPLRRATSINRQDLDTDRRTAPC